LNNTVILGISAFYHDSAAALVVDGKIVSAAQEERFTRKKADSSFPINAVQYCLVSSGLTLEDIDYIAFYDDVDKKLDRILSTQARNIPRSLVQFCKVIPSWATDKVHIKKLITDYMRKLYPSPFQSMPKILSTDHHRSHAAAAFFPSPFEEAAVLCIDGVGEWATTSAWVGNGSKLQQLWEINFPNSLGLLYSAFTYYAGFKVNFGEYKLMGLAPYGEPVFKQLILDEIIDLSEDGSFELNMAYFDFELGNRMINKRFERLFGRPAREPESKITQHDMNIASSIQAVITEVILRLAKKVQDETGLKNICLGGGVALNCVTNGELLLRGWYDAIWIQPACGDSGSSLGAAFVVWHEYLKQARVVNPKDSMQGSQLGPAFSEKEIESCLESENAVYVKMQETELIDKTASVLSKGGVVGWFQGRMEFGPRALGSRSILGDPRCRDMQKKMNLKIKFRESFRPFAPSVLCDHVGKYFDKVVDSKYMLFVLPVRDEARVKISKEEESFTGFDKLASARSDVPAITHVNYTARVQTVHPDISPLYYKLIDKFREISGCPLVINTSFNIRGEPIVCSPKDAFQCFMRTHMDYLVLGEYFLSKVDQPKENIDKFSHFFQELD
jgi:carbamoyltransferase